MACLAAQAALLVDQDGDAAQGAHFVGAGGNGQPQAQLLLHALLQTPQVAQAGDVLQPLQQLLFFSLGELQDACLQHGIGGLQQGIPVADTGTGRAFCADGEGQRLHEGAVLKAGAF
ncbi:hypothetical protein D3C72_1877510 [compost metagenome]